MAPDRAEGRPVYRDHIAALEERLAEVAPRSRFHIVVVEPFVVVGDGSERAVRRRAQHTVRWAIDRLRESYFARDPEILDIFLFRDHESYMRHTEALFGDRPDTPYGYYSPRDGALIMDISTGGGTLVHELVHPYVEANIPDCPAWFNEGLGSLYEASADRDGRIVGLVNWRLPGLKEAIDAGTVPRFRTLLSTSDDEFYDDPSGVHYAQARYLLYYLQEHDLLDDFYRRFTENLDRDPTGLESLRVTLGESSLSRFQRDWESWVMSLRLAR